MALIRAWPVTGQTVTRWCDQCRTEHAFATIWLLRQDRPEATPWYVTAAHTDHPAANP